MITAIDMLEALRGPAALVQPDGTLSGNAAFRALRPRPALAAGAEGWEATAMPGGATLWRARLPRAAETRMLARERLLATLSHEIRTPLNGVLGMAGLLAGTRLDSTQKSYLSTLTESAEHLLGLANDILDWAKLDAGKLDLERKAVRIDTLLQGVCELLSPRARQKGIEVAWAADPNLPPVLSDEGRLRQILFNLAGNAVKFTAAGGVLLTADFTEAGSDAVRLRLSIRDTGPGIAVEAQTRIFEEFAHAEPGDGARHGGAGLGLAIVRRLAAGLGGRVEVDSTPGQGSTFRFEVVMTVAAPVAPVFPLAGRTVAIVSPSPIVREAAARQIGALGGAVLVYPTVAAARVAPLDAVALVDHALHEPGRLVGRVRGRRSLVLLAAEERGRIDRYRAAGFEGWLVKPLRPDTLAARIAELDAALPAIAEPVADERAIPRPVAAGVRVLLAEDNPVNAVLATALLKHQGCAVDRVADGHEALAALGRADYDLVLMDMRMPGLDGVEAARRHRAGGGRTPIVALTANAFEEDRRACLEAGMDGFLTKPLDSAALRATVERWTPRETQARLAG